MNANPSPNLDSDPDGRGPMLRIGECRQELRDAVLTALMARRADAVVAAWRDVDDCAAVLASARAAADDQARQAALNAMPAGDLRDLPACPLPALPGSWYGRPVSGAGRCLPWPDGCGEQTRFAADHTAILKHRRGCPAKADDEADRADRIERELAGLEAKIAIVKSIAEQVKDIDLGGRAPALPLVDLIDAVKDLPG